MVEIDFTGIEKKWQDNWEKFRIFEATEMSGRDKYYVLEMFPYPSGSGLHMGHAWNYIIGDIIARFKILQGFNVMHPMGYDALGLPAENAAIEVGTHPKNYTNESIKHYIRQQKELGLSYDWTRVVSTADSNFYKWDQWIFLKMLEKGFAYQKTSAVNWCSKCNTVLANEQVHDGKCWRHEDTDVEVRHLKQWFLKTTAYADELYENLDNMNWPDKTKSMQKNWIGKSYGTEIDFEINGEKWSIFTTRPDTIFGVTFMVVSAQHSKLNSLVTKEQRGAVDEFLKKLGSVSQKAMKDIEALDKEGVFTGSYAINPATGEKVPIWAGNFVVADYGAGMVMAVPAHDERDFQFAKKYRIEIKQVINGEINDKAFTENGNLINSGEFDGIGNEEAKRKITDWLAKDGKARKVVNFKLRDWGVSRQRYWGTPIPVIHCENCGVVSVPEKDLPVTLPEDVKFGEGNPLETNEEWLNVKCPKCGGDARRESDTMDTFVNSSWYFLRYCDTKNNDKIFDEGKVKYWCPVDTYIGGHEHACMHLIYSRFYVKFLRDLGLIDFDEPAVRLFHQGMLRGEGGVKMSKSKPETIVLPEKVSDKYGIDTARFFLSSLASPDKDIDWSDKGINGSSRFIRKIFEYFEKPDFGDDDAELLSRLNLTVKNVSEYYENFEYRKATIELRELFDLIEKKNVSKETLEKFLKMMNPICPHITEELWEKIGNEKFISNARWPEVDESKILKKGEDGDLNEKVIDNIKNLLDKTEGEIHKAYLYVMPFEVEKIDAGKIKDTIDLDVEFFAVNNKNKYDPDNKAKKAKPGKPSVYLE